VPDDKFLESFTGVVGSKWPSLAASLSMSDDEIAEVTRVRDSVSPQDKALKMMKMWCAKEGSTYHQLCLTLRTISYFQ
jgi:hypothetical protein